MFSLQLKHDTIATTPEHSHGICKYSEQCGQSPDSLDVWGWTFTPRILDTVDISPSLEDDVCFCTLSARLLHTLMYQIRFVF